MAIQIMDYSLKLNFDISSERDEFIAVTVRILKSLKFIPFKPPRSLEDGNGKG